MRLEPFTLVGAHVRLVPLTRALAPALLVAANRDRSTFGFTAVPDDLTSMEAYIAGRLADRYPAGLLGGLGLAIMTTGLLLVFFMPAQPSWGDVAWRLALCGMGFGFFQAPNNRLIIGSAPPERAGAGSGMLSTSRLVGQTTGSALVAVLFGLTHGGEAAVSVGTHLSIGLAAGSAGMAMVLSWLRLRL